MIKNMFHGLCMALADSVPGVSGGTIAFILGFYDKFIGSIHDLVFEKGLSEKRKEAFIYLVKLGIGWVIGMVMAVLVLTSLFESNIYFVSSLFIGFVIAALPVVLKEEGDCIREKKSSSLFLIVGIVFVVAVTSLSNSASAGMNLASVGLGDMIYLFVAGMVAISAMFLPGISGSTFLLVFGLYMPVLQAIKEILHLHLEYLPAIMVFGVGVLTGAVTVVKGIQVCLSDFRSQMVYAILGMMIGSLYSIVKGPTTLEVPLDQLSLDTFHIGACVIGIALIALLQFGKTKMDKTDR